VRFQAPPQGQVRAARSTGQPVVRADDGRCRPGNLFDGLYCQRIGPQYCADRPSWTAIGWSAFDLVGTSQHGPPPLSVQALKPRKPRRPRAWLGVHRFHLGHRLAEPQPAHYVRSRMSDGLKAVPPMLCTGLAPTALNTSTLITRSAGRSRTVSTPTWPVF
jgi:hypothetical protein